MHKHIVQYTLQGGTTQKFVKLLLTFESKLILWKEYLAKLLKNLLLRFLRSNFINKKKAVN